MKSMGRVIQDFSAMANSPEVCEYEPLQLKVGQYVIDEDVRFSDLINVICALIRAVHLYKSLYGGDKHA